MGGWDSGTELVKLWRRLEVWLRGCRLVLDNLTERLGDLELQKRRRLLHSDSSKELPREVDSHLLRADNLAALRLVRQLAELCRSRAPELQNHPVAQLVKNSPGVQEVSEVNISRFYTADSVITYPPGDSPAV